jgi:hypothetical protein
MTAPKIEKNTALPPEPVYGGPLIERGAPPHGEVTITRDGCDFCTWLASNGAGHDLMAARLDINPSTFDKLLGPANNPTALRKAINLGKQNVKFEIRRRQLQVMRDGDKIMPMFMGKALLGDRDSGPGVNVEINNNVTTVSGMGNLVVMPAGLSPELQEAINTELAAKGKFTLPGPMSDEAYKAKLKIEGVLDARSDEAKKRHAELFALAAPTMTDVTPTIPDEGGRDV